MKTIIPPARYWRVTDGFIVKVLSAETAREAAEIFSVCEGDFRVVQVDENGNECGPICTIELE